MIFCHLKTAFDTCNHTTQLEKLLKLELARFRGYLTDRQHFVTIDSFGSILALLTRVPQDSILNLLLFLLYIKKIPSSSMLFRFSLLMTMHSLPRAISMTNSFTL
jgi:hypothetical protein